MYRQPKLFAVAALAVALLMVLTMPIAAKEIKGTVTTVDPDNYWFAMMDENGEELGLRLLVSGRVIINDEDSSIADLQAGDQLTVTVENDQDEMVATIVRCQRE